MGDPEWHDPRAAGYWLWGCACWIGSGWCSGRGAWVVGDDWADHEAERDGGCQSGAAPKSSARAGA